MVFRLATTASALLAAASFLVHGGPGTPLSFVLRNAATLVTFLDVLGLSFLLLDVSRFVATGHCIPPSSRQAAEFASLGLTASGNVAKAKRLSALPLPTF